MLDDNQFTGDCAYAQVGAFTMNPDALATNGEIKAIDRFSSAALDKPAGVTKKITGGKSASCDSTSCSYIDCDDAHEATVGSTITCSLGETYTGELKIRRLK